MHEHELQLHIKCKAGDVGRYCSLPGNPGRCEKIVAYFDSPVKVQSSREYITYTGAPLGEKVSVCSTGIGGPSAMIVMEELYNIGADTFIRVGTCGDITLPAKSDDVVIATDAARHEGASREYTPIEFPAASDYGVQSTLVQAARNLGKPWHAGVVQCKDSFYGQHDPKRMPVSQELLYKWEAWKHLGILASEMEFAALFCCAAALGVRCDSCFHAIWNQEREAAGLDQEENHDLSAALEAGIEAVRPLIEVDRATKGWATEPLHPAFV